MKKYDRNQQLQTQNVHTPVKTLNESLNYY